ncbi:MAG: heme exporter protein CcmB [Gammaproteobacteria bacterium]|nr:heme exporter protein CcmB [Gammaproteobacteria bacterium]
MSASARSGFGGVLRRDLLLGARQRSELANPIIFYVIVIALLVLAVGADAAVLDRLAPPVIWIAALLASTLSLDQVFHQDFADGSLEQLLLSHHPLAVLVAAKIAAHWLLYGVPMMLTALLVTGMLRLPDSALATLLATLLLGTPVFSLIGAVLAALTVGLRGSGLLLPLLILPLYVPLLIFSVGAVEDAARGLPVAGELYLIASVLALSICVMPIAAAAALRARLS